MLGAAGINSTGYQLVGRYTNNHSFGNAGLLPLYAAAAANNVYFFLAGTIETATDNTVRNSLQLYFAHPGAAGIPVGTALPLPGTCTPLTSFQNVSSKNKFLVNFGLGVKGTTTAGQV